MRFCRFTFTGVLLIASGICCSSKPSSSPPVAQNEPQKATGDQASVPATEEASEKPAARRRRTIVPVELGSGSKAGDSTSASAAEQLNAVREALRPFQVLLGDWKGLSQKAVTDHPVWVYDWVSDPKFPGMKITSDTGAYIRNGRLSYLPASDQFEFKATDPTGNQRVFRGTFIEPVRDVAGDEKKLQRTYKLQLTEPEPNSAGEQWRITFNQQENNRYILEVDRKRGSGPFSRVDTVHTQREGTSFALSETDYGDKTCIISQGLGTISVSYKGQSFWVCCSGCKAAFEDDPEKWIAKWEEKKKSSPK